MIPTSSISIRSATSSSSRGGSQDVGSVSNLSDATFMTGGSGPINSTSRGGPLQATPAESKQATPAESNDLGVDSSLKNGARSRIKNAINVLKSRQTAVSSADVQAERKDNQSVMADYDSKTHKKTALKNFISGVPRSLAKAGVIGTVGAVPVLGPSLATELNHKIDNSKSMGQAGKLRPVDPRDLIPDPSPRNKDGLPRSPEEMNALWNTVYDQRSKISEAQASVNDRSSNRVLGAVGYGLSQVSTAASAAAFAGGVTAPLAAFPLSSNLITQPPVQLALHGLENQHMNNLKMKIPKLDGNGYPTNEMVPTSLFVNKKTAAKLQHTSEGLYSSV